LTPTDEQSRALDAAGQWLRDKSKPYWVLHGAAGCGKTSLAQYFAGLQDGRVVYGAFSGKAAAVLRKKGCTPSSTLHSLIYAPLTERNDELAQLRADLQACTDPTKERRILKRIDELSAPKFALKSPEKSILTGASLLILDECSQVDADLAQDLLSYKVPTLVLGDPFQLPPIQGGGFFDSKPDFMLTEIHRQASESPVIQLATKAREGLPLKVGKYGDSLVTRRATVTPDLVKGVSQLLSCSNKARATLNAEMRALLGFTGQWPRKGERLICLRNNPQTGLFNGEQIELSADAVEATETTITIPTADKTYRAYKLCFENPERLKAMPWAKRVACDEFDHAYCITIHRAQGSQWDSTLIWDDLWAWKPEMQRRSRYTALTRAENRVVMAL